MDPVRRFLQVLLLILVSCTAALAQTAPPAAQPASPTLLPLTGDDEKKAKELDKTIDEALKADHWDEAIAKAEELLALRTRVQGTKHFEAVKVAWLLKTLRLVAPMPKEDRVAYQSARSMNAQADALLTEGKYAQAQPLYEKSLEIRRRLLTDDHPDTAQSYNNVAYNLKEQAKYDQARPLLEKAQEIRLRLFGEDHPDTAESYNNWASNLHGQGKYAQAQPFYEKALEIRRRLLTDEHSLTAESYNNIAVNLMSQGRYLQARPLYEKALDIYRRVLTDNHPDTARVYDNLGGNLNALGKYAEAQPLYEKGLEIRRRLLTDDHPETALSYSNLAANLYAKGEYAQAQPLFEKALEIRRRLLTDDHPATAIGFMDLASNLNAQSNFAQAQPLYEKALDIFRRILTDDHPTTGQSYNNLAVNLDDQGRLAEAQPLYEKALSISLRFSGNEIETARAYNNLAYNLGRQGRLAQAQRLFEKALEIGRRLLTDDHPVTSTYCCNVADNLSLQGKFAQAQPLYEEALAIHRRLLGSDHPDTAQSENNLAANLHAQGRYLEAREAWQSAVKSLDAARLRVAFAGLGRRPANWLPRAYLAAVLARLGQPAEAWQRLEEDLGRGLLDELAARQDQRLTPDERTRLRELIGELERLDRLVETVPRDLDKADRAKTFEELNRRRDRASIALGEFHSRLAEVHDERAGQVAGLGEIQAALPADAALIAWIDLAPVGPGAADPDGDHWGVVVRSRGVPAWVAIAGTGPDGMWTADDNSLAARVRSELQSRPDTGTAERRSLVEKLRAQRLDPLARALGASADGLPPARRIIALPSWDMAGVPVEALLADDDARTVSYAPSATIFRYLREQPRPDRHAGLLALGDPEFRRPDSSSEPRPPDHGLTVSVVVRDSNAATHGLMPGDVLLAYNGQALNTKDDLKVVAKSDKPIIVDIWRDGRTSRCELAPGKLGVMIDLRPTAEVVAANRAINKALVASRSGGETFAPLPGTRFEVEMLARLFEADGRPGRILLGADASEPELDRLAVSGELGRFAFIHLATHGVIDNGLPARSAVILTQIGLPDPLEQAMKNRPVFDGRLLVREIQHGWHLKAELVTISACETALGRQEGSEGYVGFTQALLMSGTRSVVLSQWKVDDKATALLMARFYQNLLGERAGLSKPMPKAEALREAKHWLRNLTADDISTELAALDRGGVRPLAKDSGGTAPAGSPSARPGGIRPYAHPYYWAAFILVGDPD